MSPEFQSGFRRSDGCDYTEWLTWCGCSMLYDGGLCVNRTLEETLYSAKKRGQLVV